MRVVAKSNTFGLFLPQRAAGESIARSKNFNIEQALKNKFVIGDRCIGETSSLDRFVGVYVTASFELRLLTCDS